MRAGAPAGRAILHRGLTGFAASTRRYSAIVRAAVFAMPNARTERRPPAAQADRAIAESDEVFEMAAEVFRVMSAPMRLKIISSLCNGEKNVSQLLEDIQTTQPNMSQHLNTLYQAGVLGRRREGVQIYYRIINDRVVTLCRAVCTQIAIESDMAS